MKDNITKKQLRDFGIIVGVFFPLIFGLLIPIITNHPIKEWTFLIGLPLFFLGIIYPKLLKLPYKVWIKFGHLLGFINSHFIIGFIYFILVIPISIIMRLFGYDPLNKKRKNKTTYKEIRDKIDTDLKNIF